METYKFVGDVSEITEGTALKHIGENTFRKCNFEIVDALVLSVDPFDVYILSKNKGFFDVGPGTFTENDLGIRLMGDIVK